MHGRPQQAGPHIGLWSNRAGREHARTAGKQGSISLAFESERLAIPDAKFLGVRAKDYDECDLSDDVQIALADTDKKRANEILAYPWFKDNKAWQKEINRMLTNGFKMEVESLITKDISYVTEEYVPERLKKKDWLD